MSEDLIKIKIAGLFIHYYYHKLEELSCDEEEGTIEYIEIVDKLKKAIAAENEVYAGLSERDLRTCYLEAETFGVSDQMALRRYSKVECEEKKRKGSKQKNGVLLSDAIATKMLIDILKGLEKKVEEFSTNPDSVIEDIHMLRLYHHVHKYKYLSSNSYMESLALKYDFDVNRIPSMYFTDIENRFDVDFVKKLQPIFLDYAKDSLEELQAVDMEDRYLYMYVSLFELVRLNVALENINYETLVQLLDYFNERYEDNDNIMLSSAKTLIKRKKKEFEK